MNDAHGRNAMLDKCDIDGEIAAPIDKLPGAVERINKPENAARKVRLFARRLRFLSKDRNIGRQFGEARQNDRLRRLIRLGDGGAVVFHLDIEILMINCEDPVSGFTGEFYNALKQGGTIK